MKKSIWDKILKVVIAVASAILGALGANAMNVTFKSPERKDGRKRKPRKRFPLFLPSLYSAGYIASQTDSKPAVVA